MAIGDAKYKDQTSGEIGDILVLESSLKWEVPSRFGS